MRVSYVVGTDVASEGCGCFISSSVGKKVFWVDAGCSEGWSGESDDA